VIDEEAELGLVALPECGTVKGEGKKQDIGGGEQRGLGEERTGQEAEHERRLE